MKKISAILAVLMILLAAVPALSEVFFEQVPEDWADRDTLTIIAFKTGRSDAMLVRSGGEDMLVDGGYNAFRFDLAEALQKMGIAHVKIMFNTHPHDDHIEGFLYLLDRGFTADEAMSPFAKEYNDKYNFQQKFVRKLDKAQIPYHQVFDGDAFTLGDAQVTVLHNPKGGTVNDRSAVLSIRFGESSALLTADIAGGTQHYLADMDPSPVKTDVLKAPHHGITAMVKEFLDAADPAFILGSCYEKDASSLIVQARYRDIPLYCAGQGRVTMVTDGTDWYIWQQKKEF